MSMTMEKPITLEMTRHFDAPPERVFDAWLQKSWGDWAGPPGVKGEVTLLEPRVGGRYQSSCMAGRRHAHGRRHLQGNRAAVAHRDELEMGA